MNITITSEEYKGRTINVYWDETANYNDNDHFGTFFTNVPRELDPDNAKIDEILDEHDRIMGDKYVYLLVYAYIHGGIALSTSRSSYPFNCPWDGGLGGVMAVSKERIKKEYDTKIVTKKVREEVIGRLQAEVEELDAYCQGQVFGYQVEDEDGNIVDSCWGFVDDVDYCIQYAKDELDCLDRYNYTKAFDAAMNALEDNVIE